MIDDLESTLVYFAEESLGLGLYPWQTDAVNPFQSIATKLVQVSLATPNGSGKSSVVIPAIVLGVLHLFPRAKVVLLTADGRQLDGQVMPAINSHRGKFPTWKFIEREIVTPTGGRFIAFTTDEPGRAEGWHKYTDLDGPLVIIADEAKTIPDRIFEAIDRCTYNGILLTSSPGPMHGRFYESQFNRADFLKIGVGLKDCPHITQDKIERLMAQYGPDGVTPNQAFIDSTLGGKFMEASTELRFNPTGLAHLTEMARKYDVEWRATVKSYPNLSPVGELTEQQNGSIQWLPDHRNGWLWMCEDRIPGCEYLGFGDPMTGEQSEGSLKRDTHAFGILRKAYIDRENGKHDDEIVAVLHAEQGCRWDNDIASERFDLLLRYFGDCEAIVEANNSGTEVMRLLKMAGRLLWRRERRDQTTGKKLKVMGFQTNSATKNHWIGALGRAIREQALVCKYPMACQHFANFILTADGSGQAQPGCFDDFCTGVGMALFARDSATRMPVPQIYAMPSNQPRAVWS